MPNDQTGQNMSAVAFNGQKELGRLHPPPNCHYQHHQLNLEDWVQKKTCMLGEAGKYEQI